MTIKEYLVVLPVAPMAIGATYQKSEQLPLHCTLMPWFPLPEFYFQQLEGRLSYLASGVVDGTIELQSERFRYFGAKKDIRVHVLSLHSTILYMHVMLLRLLTRMEFLPKDEQWVGKGYQPHVTCVPGNVFPVDHRFTVDRVTLLAREPDGSKRVQSEYVFGVIPF